MNDGLILLTSCRKRVTTNCFKNEAKQKKLLTSTDDYDNISELLKTTKNIDN